MRFSFIRTLLTAIAICGFAFGANAQQPQTQTNPPFATNAQWVNGVAPGYYPTQQAVGGQSAATGLNINVGPGTANCGGTIVSYAGGQFTMTANTVNYLSLNTLASCSPEAKTTSYTSTDIPIGMVTAGSSTLTSIVDDRTLFSIPGSASGSVTQILAGPGIAVSPTGGTGNVTVSSNGVGDQIQEFGPFTAQCGTSNGYALMNSAAVATLPAYTEKCLIPFSAVGAGTVAPINSGSTNIFNECPPAGLVSSVSLASPQTFRVWSNGTNWEASCPAGVSAAQPINVKAQGLACDGTTDDTAKWNSMVTAVNAANVPVSIYIPAGSKCYIPGVRTAITVPAEVYGNGPCADVASTGCISAILYDSTNGDGVNITGFAASVHDLGFIDTNASTPTQGAAVDFCPASAAENAIFHVQHSSFQESYVGIKSCQSEGSTITNNYFSKIVYDAILMDGQTPYNGGDFVISGNTANASGSPANAFIDLEGQNAGRIIGNKSVQGGGGNYNYSVYCGTIAGSPGCFNVVINSNDFENAQIETLYLDESGAFPNTFMTISGNQFLYQATTGPLVTINAANGVYFGGNTVSNGNNTASPEVVLFTGISESSDVEPQSGAIGPSSTGSISSSSNQLTVSYPAAFTIGDGIIVQGAGAAGAPLSATVSSIAGSVLTLSVNASTTVANEPVNGRNSFVTTQSGLSAVNAGFPYFNTDNSSPASYGGAGVFSSLNAVPGQNLLVGSPSSATGIFMQPGGVNTALFAANTFRPITDNTTEDGQAGYAFTGTYTYQACFATSTSISSCLAASGLTADRTWAWPDLSGTVGVIPTASTGHAICETTAHALGHCSSVVAADGTCTCN